MVTEKQLANLKPAKKGEVRNPAGPKPKLVTDVLNDLKEKGYKPVTREQIVATYQTLLILPELELMDMAKDKDQPMLNRIIAKAILGGKGFENIEKMLDRAHGKPTQKTETDITTNGDSLNPIVKLTEDELRKLASE